MRCGLWWYSGTFGWVRCVHDKFYHPGRHEGGEMWRGRYPSFIAVGAEQYQPMSCFWGGDLP